MNWDKFWREQLAKNQNGAPIYRVTTDPDTPDDDFMRLWIEKWHLPFRYFNNTGCGCCINIYEFDAPKEAIAELPTDLIEVELLEDLHRPPKTGQPSSFLAFSRSIKQPKRER